MGKPRKPLEMQKGNLTVLQQEKKKQEESLVKTGKNQLSKPPSWLINDVAVAEFKRIVKELKNIDVIGNLDLDNLGCYCNAFAMYIKVTEESKTCPSYYETPKGSLAPHPIFRLQKQYAEEMRKFASQCGLTIDSRLKVATCKVEKQEDNIKAKFNI